MKVQNYKIESNKISSGIFQIILYLFIINSSIYPQILSTKKYTTDDNLINNSITSITQDKQGFLWLTTLNGVSRFDGISFKNFTVDDGLQDNLIISSAADSRGNVWLGSFLGVSKYKDGIFTHFDSSNGLINPPVWDIVEDDEKSIWLHTKTGGIANIDSNNTIRYFSKKNGQVDLDTVKSIAKSFDGTIYFLTPTGVIKYKAKKFIKINIKGISDFSKINGIAIDNKGHLWFSRNEKPYDIIKYDFNSIRVYTQSETFITSKVITFNWDSYNTFWIGTRDALIKFSKNKFTRLSEEQRVTSKNILSVFTDTEQNTWVGALDEGLIKLPPPYLSYYDESLNLSSNTINGITKTNNNELLLATTNGLTLLDLHTNRVKSKYENFPNPSLWSVKHFSHNEFGIGSPKGIFIYSNGTLRGIKGTEKFVIFLPYLDKKNNLWASSMENELFRLKKNKFGIYDINPVSEINESIYSFAEDSSGLLWMASGKGNLIKFDGKKFTFYTDKKLSGAPIHSLNIDKSGVFWFSTLGKGVFSFQNGVFKQFTVADGLPSNSAHSLIICKNNNIWIGTDKGLSRYDGERFINYTKSDGLPSNQFMYNSAYTDSTGILWFGTAKGLVRFDPEFTRANSTNPPIHITSFSAIDKTYDINKPIILDYTQNHIQIDFAAVTFTSTDKMAYKYRVKTLDENWMLTNLREVKLSYLPPGEYLFEVFAINEYGISSKNNAVISFVITPPFWNTAWFKGLILILLLVGIFLGYKRSVSMVEKRNKKLEEIVTERTLELQQEKTKSENLIKNTIPEDLISELKETGSVKPKKYDNATILFSDFQNFTMATNQLDPDTLVTELNDIFENFDKIVTSHKLEKLKTIGDSYMIAGGIPKEDDEHAIKVVKAAIDMQRYIMQRNKISNTKWKMRIGINSGKVITGIIGITKFSYDVWGDTVNIASLMERECQPERINISSSTYELIKDKFDCIPNKNYDTKWGESFMMYFVNKEN